MSDLNEVKHFHVKQSRAYPVGWSPDELLTLFRLRVEQDQPTRAIASALNRTDRAVRLQLHRQGWTNPQKRRA